MATFWGSASNNGGSNSGTFNDPNCWSNEGMGGAPATCPPYTGDSFYTDGTVSGGPDEVVAFSAVDNTTYNTNGQDSMDYTNVGLVTDGSGYLNLIDATWHQNLTNANGTFGPLCYAPVTCTGCIFTYVNFNGPSTSDLGATWISSTVTVAWYIGAFGYWFDASGNSYSLTLYAWGNTWNNPSYFPSPSSVLHSAWTYGNDANFGGQQGTAIAANPANPSAGDIKDGVTINGVTGTLAAGGGVFNGSVSNFWTGLD